MLRRCLAVLTAVATLCSCAPESKSTLTPPDSKTSESRTQQPVSNRPSESQAEVTGLSVDELNSIVTGKMASNEARIVAIWPLQPAPSPGYENLVKNGISVKTGKVRNPGVGIVLMASAQSTPLSSEQTALIKDFLKSIGASEPAAGIPLKMGPDGKTPLWFGIKQTWSKEPGAPPYEHRLGFPLLAKAKDAEGYFNKDDYETEAGYKGEKLARLTVKLKDPKIDPTADAQGLQVLANSLGGTYLGTFDAQGKKLVEP